MKFCQANKRKKNIFKTAILFVSIIFLFGLFFNNVKEVKAVNALGGVGKLACKGLPKEIQDLINTTSDLGALGEAINVKDDEAIRQLIDLNCTEEGGIIKRVMDQVTTWTIDKLWKALMSTTAIAYKAALEHFLNTLAFDMATYLATGDKGQLPMFEQEGWGGYLKNVADSAAGAFLQELGRKNGVLKFNLCSPNADVMIKINFGLRQPYRPKKPACTFSQLRDNWEAALNDKDFLHKFQDMFNPWSNDLGIALTLQTGLESEISRAINEAAHDRLEGEGFKPVREAITEVIKTPAKLVKKGAEKVIEDSTNKYFVYTSNAVADAVDVFVNTLIGKLIDQWFRKGLVTDFAGGGKRWNNLADPEAQNPVGGISGAEGRFKILVEPNFKVRGDYDILAELTVCPDPTKAGPTNCVIDEKFREAIEKRLTVGQAMAAGYLSANGVFGFTADGLEPKYNEGYPYRSMLILRKFRIIPLGWEIAAQYLKDCQSGSSDPAQCQPGSTGGTKNLSELVNCQAAWCAGLVDPNWVLKAPQNNCAREGAGPEILSEQVSGEGAGSFLSIRRNDNYCADEKSLIKEDSGGSNQKWGYCTEEKRIWDFNAKSCAPRDNTCQTFSSANGTVSYLQNTLYFGVCNLSNVGCAKYATNGSYEVASKTVVWDGGNNPLYLNKSAVSCEAADEGCHEFVRLTPAKNETFDSLEEDGLAKAYQRFYPAGLIYEKLLPDYLKDACYDNQGRLKIGAPALCSNFVRQCQKKEVGCELYTSQTDGAKIPAKVVPDNYCPAECVGYDDFVQQATTFAASRSSYFIPKTAKTCSAENVGCEQFTNLDEEKKGGEGIEYYAYLRQCLAKKANEEKCGEFYSWEGSDESGYQLKVESLKLNGSQPAVTEPDLDLCDERIYNLPLSDPAHNSDCRQFYNRAGKPYYHLYKRTISCSNNCHPYRKTAADDDTASACEQSGGTWQANGCIYMAIPGQGASCPAVENGCREYTGNTGNDLRNVFTDDFSNGLTGDWIGVGGSTAAPSSESPTLDADNKGNSLKVSGSPYSVSRKVGTAVREGKAYVISFLAKTDVETGAEALNIFLATSTNGFKAEFISVVSKGKDWQIYKTNLANLGHKPTAQEFLEITASQNFYIDSITLTEVVDRYYLIKGSWKTPISCDQDPDGAPSLQYMLHCDQYQNRANKIHNLKQFNKLCSESAVGCELMIDTKNSKSTAEESFTNDGTTITAPADSFAYVVYDQDKLCGQEAKGCSLLGKSYSYDSETLYGDVYLKNDPDNYNTTLCGADAVGCEAFTYNDGAKDWEKYFKDPGDMVCEWRQKPNVTAGPSWLKKKVKRCGGDNGTICLSDKDCAGGVKCQTEIADRDCSLDTDNNGLAKTLGKGGAAVISQPAGSGWVGICSADNSGCGEYIDPVSRFNANLIFNGNFADLDNKPTTVDGWILSENNNYEQKITLEPNTVYRLARLERDDLLPAGLLVRCPAKTQLYGLTAGNNLTGSDNATSTPNKDYATSKTFYYYGKSAVECEVVVSNTEYTGLDGAVELKPVIIDYQLAQNLDKSSCNGVPDFNKGCVLFNERSQPGAALLKLDWDADLEKVSGNIDDQDKDSNVIIKVAPDRTCDKWLDCKSSFKDEKGNDACYAVGLCNVVDDKNGCANFINQPKTNQTFENLGAAKISNLSGYAKVGLAAGSLGGDYYPLGVMKQAGEVANLANGGFEFYGANGYPIGWVYGAGGAAKSWDANFFSVVNNPIAAQVEGIGYARAGRAFLKLGSSYDAVSEDVDVLPMTDYIITAYVNTKNLKSGQAKIDIVGGACQSNKCLSNGAKCASNDDCPIEPAVITQAIGNDWQFQVGQFKSGGNSVVKVKLYASAGGAPGAEGNFYFDDIKIRPALESKCLEPNGDCKIPPYNAWHTAQSCRLYPQTDSLACDYFEDSGKRQKGWPGYCLEYDRPPGDPNTCLLWYPVDRIKGDGFEEGASYIGKFPVYYCLAVSDTKPLNGQCSTYQTMSGSDYKEIILDDPYMVWNIDDDKISIHEGGGVNKSIYGLSLRNYFDQTWTGMVKNRIDVRNRFWDVSDDFSQIKMFDAVRITCISGDGSPGGDQYNCECNNFTSGSGIMSAARCTTVVQTVDPVGRNKYWSSRVYENSDYTLSCNSNIPPPVAVVTTCGYAIDQTPFGSVVPPVASLSSLYNPYEWDTQAAPGKQPLYYGPDNGQPRMGQELSEAGVKQIFAKTYGSWQWQSSTCSGGVKAGTDCVNNYACQGTCNTYACVNKNDGSIASPCDPDAAADDAASCGSLDYECKVSLCSDGKTSCSDDTACSGVCAGGGYVRADQPRWGPPGTLTNVPLEPNNGLCPVAPGAPPPPVVRGVGAYCAIRPEVNNIKVQGRDSGAIELKTSQVVNLTFNSKVDSQQLPLVMYAVDWGDDDKTVITGIEMRDRPTESGQVNALYHLYSYWDLKTKYNSGVSGIDCSVPGQCSVTPKIQIRDNWGWCNQGQTINICGDGQWDSFNGTVVVRERGTLVAENVCAGPLKAYLKWQFSDPNPGSSQSAYQLIVDDDPDPADPLVDTGKCAAQNIAAGCLRRGILISGLNNSYPLHKQISLKANTKYYWWVRVWNNYDLASALKQYDTVPDTDNDDGDPLSFTVIK